MKNEMTCIFFALAALVALPLAAFTDGGTNGC
jgi:hypothetical protein